MRNLHDPRVIRTRELLQSALLQMLETTTAEQIKISQLAEQAKINRVTFYQHYRDITHMIEDMKQEKLQYVEAMLENQSADMRTFTNLISHIGQQAQFYRIFLGESHFHEQFVQLMMKHLERIREDSYAVQAGIQKELLIWRDVAAFVGTIVQWLQRGMPYSVRFLANQFYLMYKLEEQTS